MRNISGGTLAATSQASGVRSSSGRSADRPVPAMAISSCAEELVFGHRRDAGASDAGVDAYARDAVVGDGPRGRLVKSSVGEDADQEADDGPGSAAASSAAMRRAAGRAGDEACPRGEGNQPARPALLDALENARVLTGEALGREHRIGLGSRNGGRRKHGDERLARGFAQRRTWQVRLVERAPGPRQTSISRSSERCARLIRMTLPTTGSSAGFCAWPLQQLPQLADRAEQMHAHSRFAEAERLLTSLVALLADVAEREHHPLPLRQLVDGAVIWRARSLDSSRSSALRCGRHGFRAALCRSADRHRQHPAKPAGPRLPEVEASVDENAREPHLEREVLAITGDVREHLHERVLHRLVGVVRVAQIVYAMRTARRC